MDNTFELPQAQPVIPKGNQGNTQQSMLPDNAEYIQTAEQDAVLVQDSQELVSSQPSPRQAVDQMLREDVHELGISGTLEKLGNGEYDSAVYENTISADMSDQKKAEDVDVLDSTEDRVINSDEKGAARSSEIVPEELTHDPIFQEKVAQVMNERMLRDAPFNTKAILKEAYSRYQYEMEMQQLTPEQRMTKMTAEFMTLKKENDELRERLKKSEEDLKESRENMGRMIELFTEMLKLVNKEGAKKKDEEKISMFEILIKLFTLLVQEAFNTQEDERRRASTNTTQRKQPAHTQS